MPKAAEIPSAVLVDSSDFFPTARGLTNVNSTSDDSDPLLQANLTHEIPKDMCPADKDIIVFKSSGYKLRDTSQATHDKNSTIAGIMVQPLQQLSSETECIFSCLINLARGKMPYECVAATYNSGGTDGQCLLYGSGNDMDGNVHLIPDVAHNHYEKGCITMDLVELCKGYPVVRHPQKTLLGFAMASKHASSFIECIELCFADRQRAVNNRTLLEQKGNTCKSIMYFYEETTSNNCILNSENKDTAPAFFVDENEALVDYASFESCYTVDTGTTADDINGRNLGSGNSNDINVPSSLQPIDEPEGETHDEISNAEENTRRSPATLQGPDDKLTNKEKYSESSASRSDEADNGKQIQTHSVKNFYPTPPMARIPPILGVLPGLLRIDSDNAQEQSSAYAKPSLGVERAPRRNIKRNKKTKTTQNSDNRMGNSLPFNGSKSVELKPRESQRRRTRQRVRNILRNSIHRV